MFLNIAEEVVLLGLDDATGRCVSNYASFAWGAGVLAELVALGRLDASQSPPALRDSSTAGNPVLDDAIRVIGLSRVARSLTHWIRSGPVEHGRDATLSRLVEAGILERVENRVLGLFTFRRYPAHDSAVENAIRQRLRSVLLEGQEPDARTRLLLSIVWRGGLLKTFVTNEERKAVSVRLQLLVGDEPVGAALGRVIDEDEAAVSATAIIAATT